MGSNGRTAAADILRHGYARAVNLCGAGLAAQL
jgi:hypothetical protein